MTDKPRFPAAAAMQVAQELVERLSPFCARIEVAGSLRRRRETVGDVEIVFVPRKEVRQLDMFTSGAVDIAAEEIERMEADGTLSRRLSKDGRQAWGSKNRLAVHVASGIPVDLFATTDTCWHNYLVCRTGPAASNIAIAKAAYAKGWRWNPYGVGFVSLASSEIYAATSEEDVFRFVGLPWAEPWHRDDPAAKIAKSFPA